MEFQDGELPVFQVFYESEAFGAQSTFTEGFDCRDAARRVQETLGVEDIVTNVVMVNR